MNSTNTTCSKWMRSARIALACGTLLIFAVAPAAFCQDNNQTSPVAQNQTATPTNSQAAQPAQPGPNTTPNATSPNSNSKPDSDQTQPATQPDQSQPATSAPDPDSQQQADTKTDTDDDQKLPKTASDVPLAGLIALLSFGSAALIHAGRRTVG
jgi:cytoskeletal protein RodZ